MNPFSNKQRSMRAIYLKCVCICISSFIDYLVCWIKIQPFVDRSCEVELSRRPLSVVWFAAAQWRIDQNKYHKAHSLVFCVRLFALCVCIFRTWSSVRVRVQIQPEVKFREPDNLVRLHDLRGQSVMAEKWWGQGEKTPTWSSNLNLSCSFIAHCGFRHTCFSLLSHNLPVSFLYFILHIHTLNLISFLNLHWAEPGWEWVLCSLFCFVCQCCMSNS